MRSHLENTMALHLRAISAPEWVGEHQFAPPRRWRFDFAWPALRIAVEVEGGTGQNGRHNRPEGYERDCEKYNAAALDGWMVLRFTAGMVRSGEAIKTIEEALKRA